MLPAARVSVAVACLVAFACGSARPAKDAALAVPSGTATSQGDAASGTPAGPAAPAPSTGTGDAAPPAPTLPADAPSRPVPTDTAPSPTGATDATALPEVATAPPLVDPCAHPSLRRITVRTSATLRAALADARPGDLVELLPGTYAGRFQLTVSGSAERPIVLCGPRAAMLDGGTTDTGYVLHLERGSHVVLSGFSVRRGLKGVILDGASHCRLVGLEVDSVGEEAVHFRGGSSSNLLEGSSIHDTGLKNPEFGEGVYVGSATNHWDEFGGGGPDRSDDNAIVGNLIFATTAESIDVKEGTSGGRVVGNSFDGAALSGQNGGDSWMDVKGNRWTIEGNRGRRALRNGFEVHQATPGWGNENVFRRNVADVQGPGYGFFIVQPAAGNVVSCDNVVTAAAMGLANVTCRR